MLIVLLMVALFTVGPWTPSVRADGDGGCMMMHDKGHEAKDAGTSIPMLLHHAKEIGLMDAQLAKLKKADLQLESVRLRTGAEIRVAELEVAAMVDDEKTGLGAIETKLKEQAALETGLRMAVIKTGREVRALLTAEQREKAEAVHAEMMEEQHEHSGGMCGGKREGKGHEHDKASTEEAEHEEPGAHDHH
jgi:Spy/CpxP family protein refolding chaperone